MAVEQRPRKRVKILAGAPLASRICWDEEGLLDYWVPALRGFIGEGGANGLLQTPPAGSLTEDQSRWRNLPVEKDARLRTGFTQPTPVAPRTKRRKLEVESSPVQNPSQVSVASSRARDDRSIDSEGAGDSEDEFIEQSFFAHEDLKSSQLALTPDDSTAIDITTTSFLSVSESSSFYAGDGTTTLLSQSLLTDADVANPDAAEAKLPRHVTSLCDLPSAGHITSIQPQTIVVNLLVGIISILPTRTVRTRYGAFKDLVELLVGDDTATGLKISFWLPPRDSQRRADGDLLASLQNLRIQDVILIESVALNAFRDTVFGCSIRNGRTKVSLLARDGIDQMQGLRGVEKAKKVKDWMSALVNPRGPQEGNTEGKKKWQSLAVDLPPDTQD